MTEVAEPPTAPARRHLAAGAASTAASQAARIAATAALGVVIARQLGPSGTGAFAIVVTVFEIALVLFSVGLTAGLTYLVSRRAWSLRSAFRQSQLAALVLGVGAVLAALGFYAVASGSVLDGVTLGAYAAAVAALPFAIAWSFSAGILIGRDRYEAYGGLFLLQDVGALVLGVALLFPFGLTGALAGFAASHVFTTAVAGRTVLRRAALEREASEDREAGRLGHAASFGVRAWGADLLQLLNYRLDLLVLAAVASQADVGVYSIALSVTALGWILPDAVQTVLFPRAASLDAASGRGELTDAESGAAVTRAVRHTLLLLLPTALVLVLLLVLVVPPLYGDAFERSTELGMLLLPGVLALGVAKVVGAVTTGRGFPIYALYSRLVDMPASAVLYVLLIPRFEAEGAAIASSASYVLTACLALYFFRRATGIRLTGLVPRLADLRDYPRAVGALRRRFAA